MALVYGLNRVALQVTDLDESVRLFAALLDTSFRRLDLRRPGRLVSLAFSPLGLELVHDSPGDPAEKLRSFHLRVRDIGEMRTRVLRSGGQVVDEFTVGSMKHLITTVGSFRVVFVEYSGDDYLEAIFRPDNAGAGKG
jgi:catechol 2,3-dioxygenase-like lactoylglutathione lyase family enzyme